MHDRDIGAWQRQFRNLVCNVISDHIRLNSNDASKLHRQYGHLGHMEYVISSGTRQHTHASPGTKFDELEVPVVPTDDYGLSDIDGHKMG